MAIWTKGMGVVLKSKFTRKKLTPEQQEAKEKFKKHLDKKKGKELDWDDVKASAKIFTKK